MTFVLMSLCRHHLDVAFNFKSRYHFRVAFILKSPHYYFSHVEPGFPNILILNGLQKIIEVRFKDELMTQFISKSYTNDDISKLFAADKLPNKLWSQINKNISDGLNIKTCIKFKIKFFRLSSHCWKY